MIVNFFTCTDDPRTLNKTLNYNLTAECIVYNGCSIISPVLKLRYNPTIVNCNYFFIPEWRRYYSIDNLSVDNGKMLYVTGTVDPIYTFRDSILTCNATAIRNEGIGSPTYIPDSSLPLYPESDYVTSLSIGNYAIAGNYHYLLTTK